MKNKVSEGRTFDFAVTGEDVKSGDVVVAGDMAGIALTDGKVGETIAVAVEGVYSLPKGSGAINQGKKVYFSAAEKNIVTTDTDTDTVFVGYAWRAAAAGDPVIQVKIS